MEAGPRGTAYAVLREMVRREYAEAYGVRDEARVEAVTREWMDDAETPAPRFRALRAALPEARRILDLASGAGTAVFHGLLHGYDIHGLEPDPAKAALVDLRIDEEGRPPEWKARFHRGVGESLPFPDDSFDAVISYQTLEHVADCRRVVEEMLRVVRPGGGVHIVCPDYRGTFEGHYLLPWLPLFPKPLARLYLRALGRPAAGLEGIAYVTSARLRAAVREAVRRRPSWRVAIRDGIRDHYRSRLAQAGLPDLPGGYPLYVAGLWLRKAFRGELNADLWVRVLAK